MTDDQRADAYDEMERRYREASRKACERVDEAVRLSVERQRIEDAKLAAKRRAETWARQAWRWIFPRGSGG